MCAQAGGRAMRSKAWTCTAVAMVSIAMTPVALAQEAPKWSDVDCAQSRIVGPTGLKCRATQVYSGGTKATSNAGGQTQHWSMVGTVNGAKLFYFLKESVAPTGNVITVSLESAIKDFSPQGKNPRDLTGAVKMGEGEYARFTGPNDDVCVATRKFGPSRKHGNQWYLLATKCVPKGRTISDADIATLMAAADIR
jgi:hypothetical protein